MAPYLVESSQANVVLVVEASREVLSADGPDKLLQQAFCYGHLDRKKLLSKVSYLPLFPVLLHTYELRVATIAIGSK